MVTLQYKNNTGEYVDCGTFNHDRIAWMSLGGDDYGYRTIDENGDVITDKTTG